VPDSGGQFAVADVLIRALRQNLAVAEAPVCYESPPDRTSRLRWRGLPAALVSFLTFWWSRFLFPGPTPITSQKASWLPGLLLMALASLLLFVDLNQPLLEPDEGRQAEIPREMLAHSDWLVPRMMGEVYYEKPPLQYWLTAWSYLAFGIQPWTARLVPCLAAWLTVLLSYLWGRRFLGARAAFLGCLGLCLSLGFVTMGRTVVLDSLLTVCVAASWYAAHRAVSGPTLDKKWWLLSAAACGLGILAKGPVALVLVVAPVGAYQSLTAGACRPTIRSWATFGAVAISLAGPWYVAMAVAQPEYLAQFLWKANVRRFVDGYDHQQPWWYYGPILVVGTLPWALIWVWLAYFFLSQSRRIVILRSSGLGFCLLAVVWGVVFFSLSSCKSPLYVAPVLAPLALMHGVCLDTILFRRVGRKDEFMDFARQTLPRRATLVVLLVSAGCYMVTGILGWEQWKIVVVEIAVTLAALAAWWCLGRKASPRLAWSACALATLAMVVVAARDVVAGIATKHTLQGIAKVARRWPGNPMRPVVCYGRRWPSAAFYLRRENVFYADTGSRPMLVQFMKAFPEVLILVEHGPLLDDVLTMIPASCARAVTLPEHEGQAALVVVRHTPVVPHAHK
jgi:4-amino-4-deoxy-L-arabinose transferase-like glycosyltransferase